MHRLIISKQFQKILNRITRAVGHVLFSSSVFTIKKNFDLLQVQLGFVIPSCSVQFSNYTGIFRSALPAVSMEIFRRHLRGRRKIRLATLKTLWQRRALVFDTAGVLLTSNRQLH